MPLSKSTNLIITMNIKLYIAVAVLELVIMVVVNIVVLFHALIWKLGNCMAIMQLKCRLL
jgi:hypothetical protein